jgi:predicted ABC-type ATPase
VTSPDLVILAGANGVGKTTFARANLTDYIDQQAFLNADDIARDVNPSDVGSAALKLAARCSIVVARALLKGCRFASRPRWQREHSCGSSREQRT